MSNDETADLNVLADGVDLILESSLDGICAACICASHESIVVCGIACENSIEKSVYECLEISILSNEVGLGVDLDHCSLIICVVELDSNKSLCRDSVRLLSSNGKSALAQNLHRTVEIAVGLNKRLLAVHHAAAGLSSQLGNHLCCNLCHNFISFRVVELFGSGIGERTDTQNPERREKHAALHASVYS